VKRRLGALLALAALFLISAAGPAAADALVVRSIDTTDYPEVRISALVTGQRPGLTDFQLRENGQLVKQKRVVPLGETSTPVGVVLAIDISGSMRGKNKMEQVKAAASEFVANRRPNEQIAVVAFNESARVAANFTADVGLLQGVIGGLAASGETALHDALRLSSGLFLERPELQPNLIVLSDGKDTVSTASAAAAQASVLASKAVAFTIGLTGSEFDSSVLRSIADASNGRYVETSDPAAVDGLYDEARDTIQNQYEITYTSAPGASGASKIDLTLSAGALSQTASVSVGGVATGRNTQPEEISSSNLPAVLTGEGSRVIAVVLVLLAGALLAYGLILIFVRDRSALESAMASYETSFQPEASDSDSGDGDVNLAETAFIRRAVATTHRLAEERGILDRVESRLEQADLPVRPAELIFFTVALGSIFLLMGLVLGGLLGGLVAAIVFGLGPIATLNFLASRRQKAFTSQLPDTLQLLSGSLRAGYSLMQGVDAVAQQVDNPMGKELGRAISESRLGRSIDDALGDVALRMGSPDFDWAVMAVRIQREVGGNLSELLMTVSETMVARERLRRDVKALTAEGRISAIVLGIMPVSLGLLLFVLNPDYMSNLFDTTLGRAMLGGSIILALFGFYWMKKTIEIEI
jgi:tight adherence protein B